MSEYNKIRYEKVCAYCGLLFEAHNKKKEYCSRRCKDVAYRLKHGIRVNANTEPYKKICIICGKQYESFRAASICCSPECTKENIRVKEKEYHKTHPSKRKSKHTSEEWIDIRKTQAKQRTLNREIENKWIRLSHTKEIICVTCGTKFYCLDRENRLTCSKECSRKYANRHSDRRIPKIQRKDFISLKRLYKRDNGICYICGIKCDYSSKNTAKNGEEYCGDLYPTIDHVIPISKGGLHSWDNVRLACWKCNVSKGDGIIDTKPLDNDFAYSERYIIGAKRTAQYTLDGKLIKVWESTAAIKRELGLNDKHIQNVCRGEGSGTGNAYGYHWEYV